MRVKLQSTSHTVFGRSDADGIVRFTTDAAGAHLLLIIAQAEDVFGV
ncbi:MAG: hypothetical protein H7Y11_12225 [Armatimonadetes bacterium]|nr:hypothetical protein [Anaerolineae bacterium]